MSLITCFLLLLARHAFGHFSLTYPPPLGSFDPEHASTFPCGGPDVNTRANVIAWPTAGAPLGIITNHGPAEWSFRAALMNDTDAWRYMLPIVHQSGTGMGHCCLQTVPGIHDWISRDAVIQIAQSTTEGEFYQCVAVKFTAMPATALPEDTDLCKNSSSKGAIVLTVEADMPADNKMPAGRNGTSALSFVAGSALVWLLTSAAFIVFA